MEMRLPKVKRTYGGILRAMWAALAVCWVANLREAPERKVQASFPKAPHWQGQGKREGQGWQEQGQGQRWWQERRESDPCDATVGQDHGAQFTRLQKPNGDGSQGGDGGWQGRKAILPNEGGRREDPDACEFWCPSSGSDGALEGCGGRQVKCRRSFEDGREVHQRVECSFDTNHGVQGCSQGWETVGQGAGQDEESLRDSQEDEGRLGYMDRTDPRALQPEGQAVRGSSSCMDFGAARRNHSREESQRRIASFGQDSQGLQVGRGRIGRDYPEMFEIGAAGGSMEIEPTVKDAPELPEESPSKMPPPQEPPKDTFVQKLEAAAIAAKEKERQRARRNKKDDDKSEPRSRSTSTRKPSKGQQGKGKQGKLEFTPAPKGNSFAALGDGLED